MKHFKTFTVSELNRRIRGVLEKSFDDVSVVGEISNFKRHTSGHIYFTLKDENAQISAVIWRSRVINLFFTPQDGMKVVASGSITLYEARGQYQIDVLRLQPLGEGELQLAFEKLKQKLAAERLFDPGHKKPIPQYPERIGIITSPTGAVIRDMLNIISRRFPAVEIILNPVKVQGEGAAQEITGAIRNFNQLGDIDVVILARGGGSIEDLWAFNEEIVARAIYDSKIPVINAVGHEIDFTIADFVADLRAPTPSAAAELVVRDKTEIIENLRNFCYNSEQIIRNLITSEKDQIASLLQSYSFNRPADIIRQNFQRVDDLNRHLYQTIVHLRSFSRQRLESLTKRIGSVSPASVLERGYTIVFRDKKVIQRAKALSNGDGITIRFHDGESHARID